MTDTRYEWVVALFEPWLDPADDLVQRVLRAFGDSFEAGDAQLARDLIVLGRPADPAAALLVILALLQAGQEGSLCLGLEMTRLAARFLRACCAAGDAGQAAARIQAWLKDPAGAGHLVTTLGEENGQPTTPLVVRIEDGLPVRAWWLRLYAAERRLEQAFGLRRKLDPVKTTAARKKAALARGSAFAGMTLNPRQGEAVGLALAARTLVISGGPGTGKTTTVAAVLRALLSAGLCTAGRVALAAPTGRAAQRMKDSLAAQTARMEDLSPAEADFFNRLEGKTIHRLLEYKHGQQRFARCAAYPLDADVVVIDEVSMVDIELMVSLIEAVRVETRLILLGDRDQLPSVNAGAILADILPAVQGSGGSDSGMAAVILDENRRSVGEITAAALACNAGDADGFIASIPALEMVALERVARLPLARIAPAESLSGKAWQGFIRGWLDLVLGAAEGEGYAGLAASSQGTGGAEDALCADGMLSRLDSARLLALVRRGRYGVESLNKLAQVWLRERLDDLGVAAHRLQPNGEGGAFHGLPIMISANDHERRLFNGDVGVVLGRLAWFREAEGGGMRCWPVLDLGAWEPAFAITVHKSQGSEYGRILLVFPSDSASRLLVRQIVYTGITRAKSGVLLFGRESVIRDAVRSMIERESGLRLYE